MAIFGRSLTNARIIAVLAASLAFPLPYVAGRAVGLPRGRAFAGACLALVGAWTFWLGAATVPESTTASLGVAAAIAIGAGHPDSDGDAAPNAASSFAVVAFGFASLAACLSRYEAWPIAAVLGITCVVRAIVARPPPSNVRGVAAWTRPKPTATKRRTVLVVAALLCALGPILWMAWNAHAHDGPLHFFRRVSNFKRAIGDGSTDTLAALALYPHLLLLERPELPIGAALGALALLAHAPAGSATATARRVLRRRWAVPLVCALAQLAFLAYGNVRDGAPAHHAGRALLATTVLLAMFAADAGLAAITFLRASRGGKIVAAVFAVLFMFGWGASAHAFADPPGRSEGERRSAQVARGAALRRAGAKGLLVTPCAYEHFALLAAFGAPERASLSPPTRDPVTHACPTVERATEE